MKTLKEALEESDVSTAITEDGVIYKNNGNGNYAVTLQGCGYSATQHDIDFDNESYADEKNSCRPLKG